MRRRNLTLLSALLLTTSARADAPPVCFEFDGSLPPGATLTRALPRTDRTGAFVPADTPRWADEIIAPAPQLITALYDSDVVTCAEQVGAQWHVGLIRNLLDVRIVVGDPICGQENTELAPDASVRARFGFTGAEWGVPRTIEIHRDGVVLVHCFQAGPDRRCITLRTTIADFASPSGWTLVRTSAYIPPQNKESAYPIATFTRSTWLPNLGVTVSTLAEYTPLGLVSSVDPLDGRSLGYASTDGGLTWSRVIDTDDPDLGRNLVQAAKHMHHLEPFEWFNTATNQWCIGAVGCLGDAEGESGQIWAYSPYPHFPPEGQNADLTLSRAREVGKRALTDLFPIDNAQSPGEPLRFIHGQDGELGGIVEARIQNGLEDNITHFSPAAPSVAGAVPGVVELPLYPFIFQMDRLTDGSILAGTTEDWKTGNPNGLWQSDATSTRWTTVRLADTRGYNGVKRTANNRFWTVAIVGLERPLSYISQLWQAADTVARTPVLVGSAASAPIDMPIFDASGALSPATGLVPAPPELPPATPLERLTITSMPVNTQFSTATVPVGGADPGEQVHIVFWLRPAPPMAGCQAFQLNTSFQTQSAGIVQATRYVVDHETNVWTRVAIVETVPPEGLIALTINALVVSGDATAEKPIDFYMTRPHLFIAPQPVRQHVPAAGAAEDRLTVTLPALASDWTIELLVTEQTTLAASVVDASGDAILIAPASTNGATRWSGVDSTLELRSLVNAASITLGATAPQDVLVPTQTLVFLRNDSAVGEISMWTARGMGEFDVISVPSPGITPTELRCGLPDWSQVLEGTVHRVRVWPDRALSETDMRRERLTLPSACENPPPIDPTEPLIYCPPPPPKPCLGDVNQDGFTNAQDFIILASNFGAGPGMTYQQGDVNLDGYVNSSDFVVIASNFGCVFGEE